jgi:protein-tyrosine phosphatase
MIDIHSHLIFGVDDGPTTLEESMKMMETAQKLGIKAIIATPHYQKNIYENEKVLEHYEKLKFAAREYPMQILLGYEVFADETLQDMNRVKKSLTLSDSEYMLVELPFHATLRTIHKTLFLLNKENICPILTHPERYRNLLANTQVLTALINKFGCMIQVDAASIAGVYGKRVKDLCRHLSKEKLIRFVASNAHYSADYSDWYMKAYEQVCHWSGEEYARDVFLANEAVFTEETKEVISKAI